MELLLIRHGDPDYANDTLTDRYLKPPYRSGPCVRKSPGWHLKSPNRSCHVHCPVRQYRKGYPNELQYVDKLLH